MSVFLYLPVFVYLIFILPRANITCYLDPVGFRQGDAFQSGNQ